MWFDLLNNVGFWVIELKNKSIYVLNLLVARQKKKTEVYEKMDQRMWKDAFNTNWYKRKKLQQIITWLIFAHNYILSKIHSVSF